jgi:hypothetical protein
MQHQNLTIYLSKWLNISEDFSHIYKLFTSEIANGKKKKTPLHIIWKLTLFQMYKEHSSIVHKTVSHNALQGTQQ